MAFDPYCQDCLQSGYTCRAHTIQQYKPLGPLEESEAWGILGHTKKDENNNCECGSWSIGYDKPGPTHSFWCPAWRKLTFIF